MPIAENFEESLRGLWLGEGPGAYLTHFFPRLSVETPHLIPVRGGFNVLYGRNGAGKTQILNALAAASKWEMGPLEGFVLEDPAWRDLNAGKERRLAELSTAEILEAVSGTDSSAVDLDGTWGYHRTFVGDEHLPIVLGILEEFRAAKTMLVTRSLRPTALFTDTWDIERDDLLQPHMTELVPMLLPDCEAPRTRAHLAEIRRGLVELLTDAMRLIGFVREDPEDSLWYFQTEEGLHYDIDHMDRFSDALNTRLNAWRSQWAWSPLLNARNIAYVNRFLDAHPQMWGNLALHSATAAVFLPPIYSQANETAENDFDRTTGRSIFTPFQERLLGLGVTNELHRLTAPSPARGVEKASDEWAQAATAHFERLLVDLKQKISFLPDYCHKLQVRLDSDAADRASLTISGWTPATRGSRAEVRWLEFALEARGDWLFFDEPEAGLHRTAEVDLAQALASPAWSNRRTSGRTRTIVVATHSPEFLSLEGANILHVDEGRARPLRAVDRENLAVLGLRPADLLSRVRTFLLVEGEHERIVFQTLLGDELHRLRTSIVVARGGKNMKDIFDSQVLFDFSDARIMALLDNTDAHKVHGLWAQARDRAGIGEVDSAAALVRAALPRAGSGENRFLAQFLTRALEDGEHERVSVWGLTRADIVLYLPPEAFGIRRDWQDALSTYPGSNEVPMKTWLAKTFGADFSLVNVRAAAESLDHIPDDFIALLHALGN